AGRRKQSTIAGACVTRGMSDRIDDPPSVGIGADMILDRLFTTTELRALSARTLAHYDAAAQAFEEGTRTHDVSQNYSALLGAIEGPPPFTLLDFGCGPGRDLAWFRAQGHEAVGLDGSARFVEMARAATGCEVMHQDFLDLSLPAARFHGIFANASLFH